MARRDQGSGFVRFDVVEIARGGDDYPPNYHDVRITAAGKGPGLVMDTPCPSCGAAAGHPCVTREPGWYWRVVATNGQTLAHSEVYADKRKARSAIINLVAAIRGDTGAGVRLVTIPLDGASERGNL